MSAESIDLGEGYTLEWTTWDPDLDLNPKYAFLAGQLPVEKWGAIVRHPRGDGAGICSAGIVFDGPIQREVDKRTDFWTLDSEKPLTIGGSLLCHVCKAHFVIENGKARAV